MLLTNGLSAFPIRGNPVFSNCHESLTKNPPDCPILCNWVFCNYTLVDEPFICKSSTKVWDLFKS